MKRLALALGVLVAAATTAPAYYHFVHFLTRDGVAVRAVEKFDLTALANNTVYLYVSEQGPATLEAGDSFAAVLSQIRTAGRAWNTPTSALRVGFGGLFSPGAPQARPHIEITFEELPPGILGLGGPTVRGEAIARDGNVFVPITGAAVKLNRDLSGQPSYSSAFFLTTAHEIGHALGLQHTLASSLMSTAGTRGVTRVRPLTADDIAAISLLYPAAGFTSNFGTVAGRVTAFGAPVHLASVVALTPTGYAVSALTNPDGSYRIEGLPSGQYYIYVHALPAGVQAGLGPAEIILPVDEAGQSIAASGPFQTQFYPGTLDWRQAKTVPVGAGTESSGIDLSVQPRETLAIQSVDTWAWPGGDGPLYVKPAYINIIDANRAFVLARSPALTEGAGVRSGLDVSVLGLGGVPDGGVHPYAADWIRVDLIITPFMNDGPRHLVFSTPDDVYVLPAGFTLTTRMPPNISAIERGAEVDGSPTVTVKGTSLDTRTQVLFDGLPGRLVSFDEVERSLIVAPPAGAPNHVARVVAANPDGQISSFMQFPPPTYTYDDGEPGAITLARYSLPAGTESMIEIAGVHTGFRDGFVTAGFGSSDIVVKQLWVLSPTLLRASVAVAPNAMAGQYALSLTSGVQVISQHDGFTVEPAAVGQWSLDSTLVDKETGRAYVYPGATAVLRVGGAGEGGVPADIQITLGDIAAQIAQVNGDTIEFIVPANLAPGYALLRLLRGGSEAAFPVVAAIQPAPPRIREIRTADGNEAHPRDVLTLIVLNLAAPGESVATSGVRVLVGGVNHAPLGDIAPQPDGSHQVRVLLSAQVPVGDQVPLVVTQDDRESIAVPIKIETHDEQ